MADYYQILGVNRNATQAEIKRAYRKKARELHPDEAGHESTERFKEVNRAYEVLSDEQKRRMYDMGGEDALSGGSGFAGGGFGGFQDIFDTFFGGATGRRGPASRTKPGQDSLVTIRLSLEDVVFGAEQEISHDAVIECPSCHGEMTEPGTEPVPCTNCDGTGVTQRLTHTLLGQVMAQTACGRCGGYGTIIVTPCAECAGEGRIRARQSVTVNIPAGIEEGMRIRLAGRGDAGLAGGPAGDLFVEVSIARHPVFSRQGDDLHCTLQVPMPAAALGTQIDIETLDGKREVEINPGTQSGDVKVLRGLGVGRLRAGGRGNLHVHVQVRTPTKLDSRQRELLQEFARLNSADQAGLVEEGASMFSRLREKLAGR